MSATQLMIIHLGPVQEFIATARRCRDLWFGSWLLSELAKAAAWEMIRQNGGGISCLIFPAPQDLSELQSDDFNVPNRIVTIVEQNPEELGKRVRETVLSRLAELRDDAYRRLGGTDIDRAVAKRQVEDFLEIFWAAYPLSRGYAETRTWAEALLNARKVTYNFPPVIWGSATLKCSLDGCRESVIPESAYRQAATKETELRIKYGVRSGERMCGICLLKRHGRRGKEEHFFSTSHVAALSLLERLTERDRPLVAEYIEKLKKLGIASDALGTVGMPHPVFGRHDGYLLFEERLGEYLPKDRLPQAKEALRRFLQQAFGGKKPLPYYALLLADGDHMGRVINAQKTPEKHRELSRTQSSFARDVRGIVRSHRGSLIYSGGDDVLALVPLHKVLACARSLAETFRQRLASFRADDGRTTPTLSAGIVIVHHLDPLADALELGRNAEETAKSLPGKNALAVTLCKRSGESRTVKGTWGTLDRWLEWFIELHLAEAIPDGAAYELRDLARTLKVRDEDPDTAVRVRLQEAARVEAVRILRCKRAKRGAEEIAEGVLKELESRLKEGEFSFDALNQLADEIIIAREFALAMELAGERRVATPDREEEQR
ncbi:MAG TPA: type III-B CRISPR-associated protein Cas10/Cmr2 [Desulfotomaculum sp.]|nr:type III-B CRISPR-associated protein Cas10/Cmr2 [Desulfotomaculum sp.]